MESTSEHIADKPPIADRIRESAWKVISGDKLAQKVQKQWEIVARAASPKMSADLVQYAEKVGKVAAVSSVAMDIFLGTLLGVLGIKDIGKAFTHRGPQKDNQAGPVLAGGIFKTAGAGAAIGLRPFEHGAVALGKAVFVGQGKA